jgi:hypothetical protein
LVAGLIAPDRLGQKLPKFVLFEENRSHYGELRMRPARLALIAAIATSFALASPVTAKNSSPNSHADANAQKVDEEAEAQGCRAYQQAPDGSWIQLACREGGGAAPAPAHGKSAQTR